jgi:outer membrane receptor protein involved in Fe transport
MFKQKKYFGMANKLLFVFAILLFVNFEMSFSGTTGKLSGRILDKNKSPVIGANVLIMGTQLGGTTDIDGYYAVINIPPGKYIVKFSCIGYQQLITKDVIISVNKTTALDAELSESIISTEAVTVTAKKPIVEVNLTSSVVSISWDDIKLLPVQELNDIVNLQAGVVDGHFRGGRLGEVQFQVDGVSINNPYNNSSSIGLDRSLLQEVQVISGTFDAEYGQAMSGVVNVVLKSGSDKFEWNAEAYSGDMLISKNDRRFDMSSNNTIGYDFNPLAIKNTQLSLSGPAGFDKTTFLVNVRRYSNDGYLYGYRRFNPSDKANFLQKIFYPTGDNKKIPLSNNEEYSGLLKITNRSINNIELSYQILLNSSKGQNYNFDYRLNPDGRSTHKNLSIIHGLDFTHSLSEKIFYKISLRQNYLKYTDYAFEDLYDPRYLQYGQPMSDGNYENGAITQGVDLGRFKQNTNSFIFKGSLTSQISRSHLIKMGLDFELPKIEFGSPGYLIQTTVDGVQLLRPIESNPPDYPGMLSSNPVSISAYAQDQIEWNDLVVRAGLRVEYFDSRSKVPSDLENPANTIIGAPQSTPKATTKKFSTSPRLGISFPISANSSIFFAYGHFYQFPALNLLFSNSDYSVLKYLQAGGISYGILGNPDLKPEKTVQYEFGYKNAINDFLGVDVSVFYKDIRDLLGVEFVSTYAAAEYGRFTNVDFGNVMGFTISLDQRKIGLLSSTLDYTWQTAKGNASDPRETATRASAGEDPRPRQVLLDWDQKHTLNATITLQKPDDFSVTTIVKYGSGQPYTPTVGSGFGAGLEPNSSRKSSFLIVDLRAEKFFKVFGSNLSLFARIFNLLNTRSANGFIFTDTGNPDYSLNPVGNRVTLMDPNRFYAPRRLEIGFSVSGITN